jgi:hypothetical protein
LITCPFADEGVDPVNGPKPKNSLPVQTMPLVPGTQTEESRIDHFPGTDPTSTVSPEDPTRSFPPMVEEPRIDSPPEGNSQPQKAGR